MKKRSVVLNGHATSVSIEDEFWRHIKRIAAERKTSVQKLIADVDDTGPENLSSALRLLVLAELCNQQGQSGASTLHNFES